MEELTVKIGVIGCAGIAKKYVRAMKLVPAIEIRALGSRSIKKAEDFAKEVDLEPSTKLYGNYKDVINDESIDAVYIPLPTSLHLEWVKEAARNHKHILLEKPIALTTHDLIEMLNLCKEYGVQLMDGTMWVHHGRTLEMKRYISSSESFGKIRRIHCSFSFFGNEDFMRNDIRVKPDLDSLGCLGDLGWYCIRAALWAMDFELPSYVVAQPGHKKNEAGVLINCGATLVWQSGCVATFDCGFDVELQQIFVVSGTKAVVRLDDFVIPNTEDSGAFELTSQGKFADNATRITKTCFKVVTKLKKPQEALMLEKFASIIQEIKKGTGKVDQHWIDAAKTTQLVVLAVAQSVEENGSRVSLVS